MKKLLEIPMGGTPHNYISATGWTLLHSLWQGAVILLIFSTLVYIFKKNSSTKYWVGIGALSLQLIASVITFSIVFEPIMVENLPKNAGIPAVEFQQMNPAVTQTFQNIELSWFEKIQIFLNSNLDLLVNLWVLGIVFFMVRLVGGYFYTQKLKWKNTDFVDEKTDKIFRKLLQKVQMSEPIYLLESALAKVPMTIGHFEKVILLPMGLATGLTVNELEAVLAHELAHIRRNDYLVNILQSVVEILFFFHPAIWFISQKIREERENCCDDLAMYIVGDKIHLAKALTHVEFFRQRENLAMAFGGNKPTLLSRIQRILGVGHSESMSYEGVLGIGLIVLASIFYVNGNNADAQEPKPKAPKAPMMPPPPPRKPMIPQGGGNVYKDDLTGKFVHIENGHLNVNGKIIHLPPADSVKLAYHNQEIDKLEAQMKPLQEKIQLLGEEMQKYGNLMQKQSEPMSIHGKELGALGEKIGKNARKQAKLELEIEDLKEGSAQRKQLEKQLAEFEATNAQLERQMEQYEKQMDEADSKMERFEAPMDSLGKVMEQYEKPMEDLSNEIEKHAEAIEKLIPANVRKMMNFKISRKMEGYLAPPRPPRPPHVAHPPMPAFPASPYHGSIKPAIAPANLSVLVEPVIAIAPVEMAEPFMVHPEIFVSTHPYPFTKSVLVQTDGDEPKSTKITSSLMKERSKIVITIK